MFIIFAMLTAFSTIMPTSSWGLATMMMPSTGRDWNTVRGTSPVPGGMSTNHEVHIPPEHVRPELLDRTGDERAAPDHRVGVMLQQQIDGHELYAGLALRRENPLVTAHGLFMNAEHTRMDGPVISASSTAVAYPRRLSNVAISPGDQALSHAAFAAYHANDMLDVAPAFWGASKLVASLHLLWQEAQS